MKLGTFLYQLDCAVTAGEIENVEKAIESLSKQGLEYLDISPALFKKYPAEYINSFSKNYGVTAGSMYWISDFLYKDNKVTSKTEDDIKETLELCSDINCKIFMPVPIVNATYSSPEERNDCRDRICEFFNKISYISEKYNIQTVFENFSNLVSPFSTIEDCEYILKNTNNVKYVLDSGNFWFAENDALNACNKFLGDTVHVHLKDLMPDKNGYLNVNNNIANCVAIGEGVIPNADIVKSLKNYGYDKTLTIEINAMNNLIINTEKSLEFLKKIM